MDNLGKKGKDKITGFEGIIIGKITYLFGCNNYGLAPQSVKGKESTGTEWFDEGRIEITGEGVTPAEVTADKPGADVNRDSPK